MRADVGEVLARLAASSPVLPRGIVPNAVGFAARKMPSSTRVMFVKVLAPAPPTIKVPAPFFERFVPAPLIAELIVRSPVLMMSPSAASARPVVLIALPVPYERRDF